MEPERSEERRELGAAGVQNGELVGGEGCEREGMEKVTQKIGRTSEQQRNQVRKKERKLMRESADRKA